MSIRVALPVHDHKGLDDHIFEHFGHAPAFLIINVSEGKIIDLKTVDNAYMDGHAPGAVPSFLAELGVNVLICRGVGRRALLFFEQLGIEVVRGAGGRVRDVIEEYLSGRLKSRDYEPSRKWHEEHS